MNFTGFIQNTKVAYEPDFFRETDIVKADADFDGCTWERGIFETSAFLHPAFQTYKNKIMVMLISELKGSKRFQTEIRIRFCITESSFIQMISLTIISCISEEFWSAAAGLARMHE